jgi:hypothetical protein
VDTDDTFHTYRIEVEGVNVGSGFKVFYDGVLTLNGALFVADEDEHPLIGWGDVDYNFGSSGVSEWQSFRHNASVFPNLAIYTAAEVCWSSSPGQLYQLQWASALPSTNWAAIGLPIAGTGSNMCVLDSTRGQARRFYRIQIVPPDE